MPVLEISGLTKRFGELVALDNVDLQVDTGNRLVVLGRSGAGKSTLLRIIAGLEKPDQGSIALNGQQATSRRSNQRELTFVAQDYALYPQLSVRQNLATALAPLALTRVEVHQRIDDALSWFQINQLENYLPCQLSGGQAQRVALAKSVVRRPKLLLLDEPLSQIDCLLKEELRELVVQLVEHYSASLIMVTHDPLDAMRIANKIAIIEAGRIVQCDLPKNIYQRPNNQIVAELLSPFGVNWIDVDSLSNNSDHPRDQELIAALKSSKQVGFRPEDVSLHPDSKIIDRVECLVLDADFKSSQHLGFADLAVVIVGDRPIKCLVQLNDLPKKRVRLVVPRRRIFVIE